MKKHYINTVDYSVKTYTTNISWNRQSVYLLDRQIIWYFNQNSDSYTTEWESKDWREFQFTCDYTETFKTWNYIDFEWSRYSIKNIGKNKGITQSFTRLTLIKKV